MNRQVTYGNYARALQQALPWLLAASVGLSLITYGALSRANTTYSVHYSYVISLREPEQGPGYSFDGYYALQATDLFTATVARWLTAPEIVAAAHESAGLPVTDDVRQLARSVRADKTAPQLIQVTVTGASIDKADALATGLQAAMVANVAQYHEQGSGALQFNVFATPQFTSQQPVATTVVVGGVFMLVVIVGINGVLLRESFRAVEAA